MRSVLLVTLLVPSVAEAGDLGDALAYIDDAVGEELIDGYQGLAEAHPDDALPLIVSRDVKIGAPLDSYDCDGSPIDDLVMRTSGEERWAHRWCMKTRWNRDSLPGYRTLGDVRLHPRDVDDIVKVAARRSAIPAGMLHKIIEYSSGYRPGVISDDGHFGLMQLKPEILREMGISFGNLLDPRENIMVGTKYFEKLIYHFSDVKLALAAYIDGPRAVEEAGNVVPTDRETVWFTREMLVLYYSSIRDVPNSIAANSMEFVWTWLD